MNSPVQVPFHRPSIGDDEITEVVQTMKSGWLTTGPRTLQFEQEFRQYVGAEHAQAVNSCTAGLHLALRALKIGPGHEVITTPITFCSTVNTILHAGAIPVLADVGPDGNIDTASIASRVTGRTRAIVPVHMAGLPCDMDTIWALARQKGLHVIEDCAHAVGSHYRGRPIGSDDPALPGRSSAHVFSFYATKNMTTGEGGMVTTHDMGLADSLKILCLHGISKNAWNRYSDRGNWYYEVLEPGFKYNLSDVHSAIGIHQLRKLEQFIELRTQYAEIYNRALADVEEFELPPDRTDSRHSWHLYMLRLNLNKLAINRDEFINMLREKGVGTSVHFIPIPLHPFFSELACLPQNQCPRAMALYPRTISMPLYPALTVEQVEYSAKSAKEIAHRFSRSKRVFVPAAAGLVSGAPMSGD